MPLENPDGNTLVLVLAAIAVPLFGFLSVIANGVFKTRTEAKEARNASYKTADSINTIETNTSELSDGFGNRVDRKLTAIMDSTTRLESRLEQVERSVLSHLEWHVTQGRKRP
jgi:uncharacterized phage infection (PIP) family protein YhgE